MIRRDDKSRRHPQQPARTVIMNFALASSVLSLFLVAVGPLSSQQSPAPPKVARPTMAQQLVDQFIRAHAELVALELAVTINGRCKTIAATAVEDVGEKCDADELGPIQTGQPGVEPPTKEDPVYDITQPLHDAAGHLIGAVGMDIRPDAGPTRLAVITLAGELRRALEALIPSKAWLVEPATP